MFSLSFSKIEKYLRCPLEYHYYCDRTTYNKYHQDTPPLVFGSIMHGVLNDYYKVLEKNERTQEKLIALFRQKYNANKIKHDQIFKNPQILGEYTKIAGQEFKNFLAQNLSQQIPYVATEENLKLDLGGIELIAKIDRIDSGKNGLKIIDYKTGKYIEDKPDPLQLDLYALAAFIKFPEVPIHKKVYYYLYDDRFVEIKSEGGEYRRTREFVLETADKIQKTKQFEPKRNRKCCWCDFQDICSLFK